MKNIPGFPISCYYSRFSQDTYDYIDWHWHVDFQFCLTVRGTVLWSTESCRDAVSEGKAIFINSQRTHMAKPLGKEAAFFCVNFSPDFICPVREESLYENSVLPVLQGPALNRKVIDCHTVRGAEILDILTEMARTFDAKEDGYQFDLMGNVFKIWRRMRTLLDGELTQQMDTVDIRFQNMLTYLQKHYAVEFSLDAVADYIGLSRSECCRYFKKQSGQNHFRLSASVPDSQKYESADRDRHGDCRGGAGLWLFQPELLYEKIPGADRNDAEAVSVTARLISLNFIAIRESKGYNERKCKRGEIMAGIEKAVFMNMCMVYDEHGRVLALDKVSKSYEGTTFPGGHVEPARPFGNQ